MLVQNFLDMSFFLVYQLPFTQFCAYIDICFYSHYNILLFALVQKFLAELSKMLDVAAALGPLCIDFIF